MWKAKKKVIKLPKERWKTGLWIWICSPTESQKVIPFIKKRKKKKEKKASQKVSEKHGLKINCFEGAYVHLKKSVLLFENISGNMCEWKHVWKYIVLKNWKCVFKWVYQTPPKRGEKKDSGIVWCWLISHNKFVCIFGFHLYCNNFLDSLFVEI